MTWLNIGLELRNGKKVRVLDLRNENARRNWRRELTGRKNKETKITWARVPFRVPRNAFLDILRTIGCLLHVQERGAWMDVRKWFTGCRWRTEDEGKDSQIAEWSGRKSISWLKNQKTVLRRIFAITPSGVSVLGGLSRNPPDRRNCRLARQTNFNQASCAY